MGPQGGRASLAPPLGSANAIGELCKKNTASKSTGEKLKNGDGSNDCKQTTTRSDIKRPARYNEEGSTQRDKRGKKTKYVVTDDVPLVNEAQVTVSFAEGGLNMNMEVTDEEIREFDGREHVSRGAAYKEVHNNPNEDLDEDMDVDANNNVTNDTVVESSQGLNKEKAIIDQRQNSVAAREKEQDPEECKFMERFAVFMEERGFLMKTSEQEPAISKVVTENTTRKQPVKRRLDMGGTGEQGENLNCAEGDANSVITIYKPAVQVCEGVGGIVLDKQKQNNTVNDDNSSRVIISSDEFNNTSDESLNVETVVNFNQEGMLDVTDRMHSVVNRVEQQWPREPVAHTSHQEEPTAMRVQPAMTMPMECAEEAIRKAE